MKHCLLVLVMLIATAAQAQIGLKLESNHDAYLRYEPIRLRITVRNLSGNTLVFGGENTRENGNLILDVKSLSGRNVRNLDLKANPMSNLIMAPGEERVLYMRLNTLFDVQREDTYTVRAIINHKRLPTKYRSDALTLEVRDGMLVQDRTVGLPSAQSNDMIESMKLSLLRYNGNDGSLYCLRADDRMRVYGTFRLGPFIMGGQEPQMEIENGNSVHILLQVAPRLFSYTTFSIGRREIKKRQEIYYTAAGGLPRLSRETGYLKVHNVALAQVGKDFNQQFEKPFGDENQ